MFCILRLRMRERSSVTIALTSRAEKRCFMLCKGEKQRKNGKDGKEGKSERRKSKKRFFFEKRGVFI